MNKSLFYSGQIVKYSKPEANEENERFIVLEIHESDGILSEKLHIQLICDMPIKPTSCYFSSLFIPA